MDWTPITEEEIQKLIDDSYERMNIEQRRTWDVIKVPLQKWAQEPWGNEGNGFWVVALIGSTVTWFNDIEEGFNSSTFTEFGRITEYYCNQDNLEWQVSDVVGSMQGKSYRPTTRMGPPEPLDC